MNYSSPTHNVGLNVAAVDEVHSDERTHSKTNSLMSEGQGLKEANDNVQRAMRLDLPRLSFLFLDTPWQRKSVSAET